MRWRAVSAKFYKESIEVTVPQRPSSKVDSCYYQTSKRCRPLQRNPLVRGSISNRRGNKIDLLRERRFQNTLKENEWHSDVWIVSEATKNMNRNGWKSGWWNLMRSVWSQAFEILTNLFAVPELANRNPHEKQENVRWELGSNQSNNFTLYEYERKCP